MIRHLFWASLHAAAKYESIETQNELAFEEGRKIYQREPACSAEGARRRKKGVGDQREEREREREKRAERSVHARRWLRIGALYENEKVTKAEVKSVHT